MKKTIFYCVMLAGIATSFSSCVTTVKMAVDENIPAEQTATVTFVNDDDNGWFFVQEWHNERNSKRLGKELYGKGSASDQETELTVPAGNNSFIFDAKYLFHNGNTNITHTINDIELKYNLEQGKEYRINCIIKRSSKQNVRWELFVGIFDVTGRQEALLKEWKIGEIN